MDVHPSVFVTYIWHLGWLRESLAETEAACNGAYSYIPALCVLLGMAAPEVPRYGDAVQRALLIVGMRWGLGLIKAVAAAQKELLTFDPELCFV